ncbi:hypothetical protein ACHAXT_002043 [Thalassiosira profunda]
MKPLLAALGAAAGSWGVAAAAFRPAPPGVSQLTGRSLPRDGRRGWASVDGHSAFELNTIRRWGGRSILAAARGEDCAIENASGRDDGSSNNSHRTVSVLLPDAPGASDTRWRADAVNRLNELSHQCGLPIIDQSNGMDDEQATHYLTAVPYPRASSFALAIHHNEPSPSGRGRKGSGKKRRSPKLNPIHVDLCPGQEGRLGYRLNKTRSGEGGGELLLRALGLTKMLAEKKGEGRGPLVVYDLTAGLARDSLVIVSSFLAEFDGESLADDDVPLRLHMAERDPIVAALLSDAARRLDLLAASEIASADEKNTAKRLQRCLSMEEGDGVSVLHRLQLGDVSGTAPYPPDVVYLDPMFPPRKKKSASVKKDMAMLHSLLGTAEANSDNAHAGADATTSTLSGEGGVRAKEERDLLLAAHGSATRRVVVKRPVAALPLGLPADGGDVPMPSHEVRGSVNRFDVYVIS